MSNSTYPVLCGGTFFTLVLEARIQQTSKRNQYAGKLDGLSQPETLAGLGRVVYPEYSLPKSKRTCSTNASGYRSCDNNGTNLSFLFEQPVTVFDNRVKTDYPSALKAMVNFVDCFLEVGTSTAKEVCLLKALLELIDADRSIDDTQVFYIGESGQGIKKATLRSRNDFCLQSFLLGVWHFIVVNRRDNKLGKATFDLLCPPKSRATRKYEGTLGTSIPRVIKVTLIATVGDVAQETMTAAGEKDERSTSNADVQSSIGTDKQPEPKALLDLFEDAIDEFDIAEFVDSDYTAMQLRMNLATDVDAFVVAMRYHLKSFRRQQNDVFKNVMSFVNAIEQYSAFLSMKMFCGYGDGSFASWLSNNTSKDVEAAWKYRNDINLLYGLISDGGTLSVYGYSTAENADEAERNEEKFTAEKSPSMNTQVINNPNEVSHDCYNLFVISDEIKNYRFTMPKDRSLQGDSTMIKMFADLTPKAIAHIKTFPSLFMNENTQYGGQTSPEQEAYYGFVTNLRVQENGIIKVRFRCDAKINQQQINDIARMLDIHEGSGIMELNHTHWTIKNVDLIEELTEAEIMPKECTGESIPMNMYHDEPRYFSQTGDRNTLIAHADSIVMHDAASSVKDFYRDILIYLESKRVLYNPGKVEQREHCIQSVLDMKDTLSKSVMGKMLFPNELEPIRKMILACVDYLNSVGKPEGQLFVITAQSVCDWFDNSPKGSLGKLRGSFRSVIKGLEDKYGLHYSKDIW